MIPYERVVEGYGSVVPLDAARAERYKPLTEGIKDANRRRCLEFTLDAMLHARYGPRFDENAVKAILHATDPKVLEGNTTADIATYTRKVFPIVTRSMWSLNLLNLISVQPMNAPAGKIFYQDVVYATSGGLYDPSLYSPGARVDRYIDPYYALSTENPGDTVRELELTITSDDVTAETRRLNANWSDEVEQDLRAYFGIEMDSLMVQNLGDEIAREIDQAGIDTLVAGATAGNVNWSQTATGAYASLDPKVYNATLWDALIDADQAMWEATNRNSTWIIAGATEINRLRKLGSHRLVGKPSGSSSARSALEFQGLLDERWEVWQARHFPADKMLLGFRGSDFSDTGAVYSPYIPLEVKDPVKDLKGTNAYTTTRGVQTRGVTKVVNGDCFATVTITA